MNDRTEQLVRDAFAEEAARAVDSREVLAAVRGRRPRRSYGLVLATAAVVVVVAAVATFVVPTVFRESDGVPPAGERHQRTQATTATNVLVVGLDTNENTDSIVLARFAEDGSTSVVSLPRDSWVSPAGKSTRLNQVYRQSGVDALAATIGDLTGVHVDHWATVDMAVLPDLVDALGGAEVCLRAATADRYAGADFPAGKQVLGGDQALAFLRQRHGLPNGDLDRIVRLQAFLKSLLARLDAVHLRAVAPAVQRFARTDPGLDVIGLVQAMAAGSDDVRFGTIPYTDLDQRTPDAGSVIEVDPAQVRQFVEDLPSTPPTPAGDVPCVN